MANRQERRKAAVMRVRRIPVSALKNAGDACGWEGCARSSKGL
jgi:hypothetical protein